MTSPKRPRPKAPTSSPDANLGELSTAGLGDLVGGLVGGILEQVKQLAGWVGHPLAKPLDMAEGQLSKGVDGGPVTSAEMAKALEVQLRGVPGLKVHVVGHATGGAGHPDLAEERPWVVLIGDDTPLEHAFRALRSEIAEERGKLPACQNVVFWTRKWEAPAWTRAFGEGLGGLASKALWAKLWDANGTLVGPIARAPPPLVPMGEMGALQFDLKGPP